MKLSTGLVLAGLSLATAATSDENLHDAKKVTPPKGKWFDRKLNNSLAYDKSETEILIIVLGYVVIVLENTNKDVTFGNPYFLNLTNMGMTLGNYHANLYSL